MRADSRVHKIAMLTLLLKFLRILTTRRDEPSTLPSKKCNLIRDFAMCLKQGILRILYGVVETALLQTCNIRLFQSDFKNSGYLWFICWDKSGNIFSRCWSIEIGWRVTIMKTPIELTVIYVVDWKKRRRKIYFVNLFILMQPAGLWLWKYCMAFPTGAAVQNNAKFFEDPSNFSLEYEARKAKFPEYNPEAQIERNERPPRPLTEEEQKAQEELAAKFRFIQEEFARKALAEKVWNDDLADLSMAFFMALTVVMYISYFRAEGFGRTS